MAERVRRMTEAVTGIAPIDPRRIARDIEAIAGFSESPPEVGYSRPTFSRAWRAARDYVIAEAEKAGAEHIIDAAGNVHIRHRSVGWERRVWLSGSHLDSVPSGGKYDGVMGVVIPLEILRVRPEAPLELVIFCEEEGTTFSLGMIGSRAWTGAIDLSLLGQLKNRQGESVEEAGAPYGLDIDRLRGAAETAATRTAEIPWTDRVDSERYLGLVEVHAEQGVSLWEAGLPLAVVDRINGRRQFDITVTGQANHAGSTGMGGRRDALAGAAQMIGAVETLGLKLDAAAPYSVCTVGRMVVAPGAVNVIPGEVAFSVDMRAQEERILEEGEVALRQTLGEVASRRGLSLVVDRSEIIAPAPLSGEVSRKLHAAAGELGLEAPIRPSGALHDAAILANLLPTAMIFVASREGISHNPGEFSRTEDIALAASVLLRMIEGQAGSVAGPITLSTLNELSEGQAVTYCGGFFEDSPWVVEEALRRRPFASLEAFHEACRGVLEAAGEDARLALIRAHPDLVGRLAREGRLGAASTKEQAAAGLGELSPEEAEAFDRYNAAYHERFGFPFVICARKNRKDAILEAFPVRLKNGREEEIATALEQIAEIAWLRMTDAITTEEEPWQS
ncbi:MAG: 2-oxo-4-hydroxy-4-carboxy-5-ureidoimidazoline decarboxylase [Spirochaetota bacterium]